jgi:hypothetical protein
MTVTLSSVFHELSLSNRNNLEYAALHALVRAYLLG